MSEVLFEKNHEIVNQIISSLQNECYLQREYIRIVDEERIVLQKLKNNDIESCIERRQDVIAKIKKEQETRIGILKSILKQFTSDRPEFKLTAVAERVFHAEDTRKIKELCGVLKQLILLSQRRTKELEGVVGFSVNLINGSLAAIYAHANPILPAYNSAGKVPSPSDKAGSRHHMSRLA